eukprot:gene1417-15836_t
MSAFAYTEGEESMSSGLPERKKQFRWTTEMVGNLIECLREYNVKMEFEGLDFDGDRPMQYKEVRKEMAKVYQ